MKINCVKMFLISLIVVSNNAMEKGEFIPSKENCGAALGEKNVSDDIHDRISCMLAGYKDVYMGQDATSKLNSLYTNEKELIEQGKIKQKIIIGNLMGESLYGNILILFMPTENGYKQSSLLIRYLEGKIAQIKRLKEELELATAINHYLVGHLLGYDEKDIQLFYARMNLSQEKFELDRLAGLSFIQENS